MTRKIDHTFDSDKDASPQLYQLASGYISETTILFEKESVVAVIQATGSVEFYNLDDKLIAEGKVPSVNDGKGMYQDIGCYVENNLIELRFPIYEWIDNYPNYDGEHDRWDTKTVGFQTMTLNLSTCSVSTADISKAQ